GSIVVVLGRLVVVIAGLVVILNLTLAGRECVVGGLVCPDRLVVVARLVPFAGLIVRFVMVLTARHAAGRRGASQDVAGLMQGHTASPGSRLRTRPESGDVGERSCGMTISTATSIANGFGARANRSRCRPWSGSRSWICWTSVARISRATGGGTAH